MDDPSIRHKKLTAPRRESRRREPDANDRISPGNKLLPCQGSGYLFCRKSGGNSHHLADKKDHLILPAKDGKPSGSVSHGDFPGPGSLVWGSNPEHTSN